MVTPPPTGPIHLLASVAGTLAPLPFAPPDAPSPVEDGGTAASPPNSNSIRRDEPAPARAPVLDGAAGDSARPVTPTDAVDVAAPFREPRVTLSRARSLARSSREPPEDPVRNLKLKPKFQIKIWSRRLHLCLPLEVAT